MDAMSVFHSSPPSPTASPGATPAPSTPSMSGEPATDAPPVRRFRDPGYRPVAATLGELRARIDAIDEQVVALLAERGRCVRDATRFKRGAVAAAAVARQAAVFSRVRALADRHDDAFPGLANVVERAYRTLVAGFVAGETHLLAETEPLPASAVDAVSEPSDRAPTP